MTSRKKTLLGAAAAVVVIDGAAVAMNARTGTVPNVTGSF